MTNSNSNSVLSKSPLADHIQHSLIRRKEVENQVALGRSAIYKLMSLGQFPRPIKLTNKAVAWQQSAINSWIESRIAASDELRG
jgi:prophage regulatory protein